MLPILFLPLLLLPQSTPASRPAIPSVQVEGPVTLASDVRLAKKITINQTEVTINQLLSIIGGECGVALKMRDQKKLGEHKVYVHAKDVQASRLLDAVAALFRYKHASSEWGKTVQGNGYALSTGAQDYLQYARQVKKQANQKFLRNVQEASSLLQKTKDELNTLSGNGTARTGSGGLASNLLFHDGYKESLYRDGLNAFLYGLSKKDQSSVVGGKPVIVTDPAKDKYFAKLIAN